MDHAWIVAAAWIILALSFWAALIGTFLPGLPGALLVVLALLLHKWLLPDFYPWWSVGVVVGLALLSWLADFLATTLGAKWGGASKWGMLGAALGGFLGTLWGLPGILLGSFVGAVLGDLKQRQGEWQALLKSGGGATVGVVVALVLRLGMLMAMALFLGGVALFRLAASH